MPLKYNENQYLFVWAKQQKVRIIISVRKQNVVKGDNR